MYLGEETESKYSSVQSEEFGDRERRKTLLQKRKRQHMYSQSIDLDVRAPEDTNPPDEEFRRKSTQKMCQFKTDKPFI